VSSAYAFDLVPESPMAATFQMDAQLILEVIGLNLTSAELRVLLYLANRMNSGNRVEICKARIAREIHVSAKTVARAIEVLLETRLLHASDGGSVVVNPLYLLRDGEQRDALIARFGVDAVPPTRRTTRKAASPKPRHLRLVQ
jgi:hypothetical protein